MKQTVILSLILLLSAGVLYSQEKTEKAPQAAPTGTLRSITVPVVRIDLKEGEGKTKAESYCAVCHSLDYITTQPKFKDPKAQWTATVNKMVKTYGAPIPAEEAEKIIDYLAANYGAGNR